MSEYAIRVRDVSKLYKLYDKPQDRFREALGLTRHPLYREHYALNGLSFDVRRGETVGIIGTNGAGKSTILKIITGVLNPTSGSVDIQGRISALLELGAGFNMEYTGLENVYLNGTMLGFSRAEIDARLDDILAFADIGDFINQPVKTYSSGMFVRLAFAVAINIDPEILIVDEALSVGDVFFQAKCYRKFEEFKAQGKTILFVSHDLGSISRYCDSVVLLHKGKKLAEGSPRDMIDLYKKVLVDQIDAEAVSSGEEEITGTTGQQVFASKVDEDGRLMGAEGSWLSHYKLNPHVTEYGDGRAEILDIAVIDEHGSFSSSIIKGSRFSLRSKVLFHEPMKEPIFTYTFKNSQGVAITGTNTMFERFEVGQTKEGEILTCTFTQEMNLQGGEYLLSMSCTGYEGSDFVVHHRLYDLLSVTVVSDKNTVGFYDMNSEIKIEREDEV